jgi:ubiquitin carboxyl-terminal hydrolase 36/42
MIMLCHCFYFLAGGRSGWCFMCALQEHAMKVKQLRSPFSPVDIVSHLRNIGRGLGYGKQEDAHEFMRLVLAIILVCF